LALVRPATGTDPAPSDSSRGVRPADAQGRPLNLDFEAGTLEDWHAEGEAFAGQPIRGDAVAARRGDMHSRHEGDYWVGSTNAAATRRRAR
jgi:hypothetical protein